MTIRNVLSHVSFLAMVIKITTKIYESLKVMTASDLTIQIKVGKNYMLLKKQTLLTKEHAYNSHIDFYKLDDF